MEHGVRFNGCPLKLYDSPSSITDISLASPGFLAPGFPGFSRVSINNYGYWKGRAVKAAECYPAVRRLARRSRGQDLLCDGEWSGGSRGCLQGGAGGQEDHHGRGSHGKEAFQLTPSQGPSAARHIDRFP